MNDENKENTTPEQSTGNIVDKVQSALKNIVDKGAGTEQDDKVKEGYSDDKPEVHEVPDLMQAMASATPEQLQQFKQMLDQIPGKVSTQPKHSEAHLLKHPKSGKYVVAFSDQYPGTKYDEVKQQKVDCPMINVRLLDIETGKTEDIREEYSVFMYDYEEVPVKLLKLFVEPQEAEDGITESVETGESVVMVKKWVNETYRIALPEGKEITLPARVINAGAGARRKDTGETQPGNMGTEQKDFNIV